MIIDTHSRISSGLPQTAQSRLNKTAANSKPESSANSGMAATRLYAAAAPPTETSDSQATVTAQNIASALSPIQDAEAARALIQKVRHNFLANPGSAMLAQANQVPENALRLLQ
jgi:flagellin